MSKVLELLLEMITAQRHCVSEKSTHQQRLAYALVFTSRHMMIQEVLSTPPHAN